MAWMNDYEWDFVKDSMDKKNVARSARSTRTHCGKGGAVKFPSDYLTKKELKAMSGEVIQYASLKKPMSWGEFKALPEDLKKEYITSIREKFGAPDKYIAQMFGVSQYTLCLYFKDLGLGAGKSSGNSARKWKTEEFLAWSSGADLEAEVAPVPEETIEPAADADTFDSSSLSDTEIKEIEVDRDQSCGESFERVCAVPFSGRLTFNCDAEDALNTIRHLIGNKKVSMTVSWDIMED